MNKDLKKKNIIIGFLMFIIFVLLTVCIYFIFVKEDSPKEEKKPLEIKTIQLDSKNKEVVINNNKINMKLVDFTLYINDSKIDYIQFEGTVYVTNNYALFSIVGQCGNVINYGIDEKGNIIEVYKNIVLPSGDNLSFQMNNIRVENEKIVADLPLECFCYETDDHKCNDEVLKVEIVKEDKSIVIKKLD